LLGAADALRHSESYTNPLGREVPFWENARETALSTLGVSAWTRAFAEGSRMTPLQAFALPEPEKNERLPSLADDSDLQEGDKTPSLTETSSETYPEGHLPTGEHLTRRETDVLHLLAQGHTNAEIAEQLVLSVVTVNSYLRSVYSKMGVSSRTRAARYAMDHHLI
jgi:DNA-binding CsgD family transcriptional regulator